jgi:hypothetical protein
MRRYCFYFLSVTTVLLSLEVCLGAGFSDENWISMGSVQGGQQHSASHRTRLIRHRVYRWRFFDCWKHQRVAHSEMEERGLVLIGFRLQRFGLRIGRFGRRSLRRWRVHHRRRGSRYHIAKWDGKNWSPVGTVITNPVLALTTSSTGDDRS